MDMLGLLKDEQFFVDMISHRLLCGVYFLLKARICGMNILPLMKVYVRLKCYAHRFRQDVRTGVIFSRLMNLSCNFFLEIRKSAEFNSKARFGLEG